MSAQINPRIAHGTDIIVGSIRVQAQHGNLLISKTHTPDERFVVERADIDDFLVAVDGALARRHS